jgi:hypothetical protein
MKEIMKKKWNEMNLEERQMVAGLAGIGASLLLSELGRIIRAKKNRIDVINLVVPKDCELMIFVKGGK